MDRLIGLGRASSQRAAGQAGIRRDGLRRQARGWCDAAQALARYGPRIIEQVDFENGRVRLSASIDAALSVIVFKREHQQLRIQANVVNLTDRLNVINCAGLFSGTALAPPRSFGVRAQLEF